MRANSRISMALTARSEKMLLAVLAVVTGALILADGVAAKPSHCSKDCKQDVKKCLALVPKNKDCTGTKAEKAACRQTYATQRKTCRNLVKVCKQQTPGTGGLCVPSSTTTTTTFSTTTTTRHPSPSGAFLDPSHA